MSDGPGRRSPGERRPGSLARSALQLMSSALMVRAEGEQADRVAHGHIRQQPEMGVRRHSQDMEKQVHEERREEEDEQASQPPGAARTEAPEPSFFTMGPVAQPARSAARPNEIVKKGRISSPRQKL